MWWSVSPSSSLLYLPLSERSFDEDVWQCNSLKDFASLKYLVRKPSISVPVRKTRREGYGGVRRSDGFVGPGAQVSLQIDSESRVEIRSDLCVTFNLNLGGFYDVSEVFYL